jgi:hypothetical protein
MKDIVSVMWHRVASKNISEKYMVPLKVLGQETFHESGNTKRPLDVVVFRIFSFTSYTGKATQYLLEDSLWKYLNLCFILEQLIS